MGFATFRATEAADPNRVIPRMYSMSAYWPVKLDVDWGFMKLAIDDITLKLNTGSDWKGLKVGPYADLRSTFGTQGLAIKTGDTPMSEADAFIAASFTQFSPMAMLAFMVVGPMVDLKLVGMQVGIFGRRFAARFAPTTFVIAVLMSAFVGWWLLT